MSQPVGSGPHIYISQEKVGPIILPGHWVPFSSPFTTCRATAEEL
jgi:hypothetical protein